MNEDELKKSGKACESISCPWKQWGNSVLAINAKYWTCSYCSVLIEDGKPFEVIRINGTHMPFIFDKETCMILQIRKMEAGRVDKT